MNNKDIDRIFQENLKNLEATPGKRVWNSIESKLQKKKRKVIPFWWFVGGAVAIFLLGFIFSTFSDDKNILEQEVPNTIITDAPKKIKKPNTTIKSNIDSIIQQKNEQEKVLVADEKTIETASEKESSTLKKINKKKKLVSTKNAMKKVFLAENEIKKDIISSKEKEPNSTKKKTTINENDKIGNTNLKEKEKKSNLKKVDFNNYLEKKDTIYKTKLDKKKWAIAPVFAVINSNSFSNSSPLDKSLSNSTKGKSSFSYGMQIAYQFHKRWTIQTGIHLQETSFTNKQIVLASTISSRNANVSFNNRGSVSFENTPAQASDLASNSVANRVNLNGDLNQTYGYIEIPIEVKYIFLNTTKFNSQLVAGFSSLFLNKNEVNLNTQFISNSGEATNLNNINFSGNFGFDFNYSLNKNWSLNLNPMFKAQLNTFNNNANGFAPFNIGIYSGLKYQF